MEQALNVVILLAIVLLLPSQSYTALEGDSLVLNLAESAPSLLCYDHWVALVLCLHLQLLQVYAQLLAEV